MSFLTVGRENTTLAIKEKFKTITDNKYNPNYSFVEK